MTEDNYLPIIGLEIHVEMKTLSKMFCGCFGDWFGKLPNSNTCPVCLGLPGALPVPNKKAIEWCVMLGLALNCQIPNFSKFDRKNYFYPDLPKGYQISQYDMPFAINGFLKIKNKLKDNKDQIEKIIRIRRVHLEEDTGKLLHARVDGENVSLIDFNRSGVPLFEIVTEPDIRGSEEARIFLKKLHQIIRYLSISDADMEKGSMRLEPNISVRKMLLHASTKQSIKIATSPSAPRKDTNDLPPYKVEVKNINSFNFTKKAIDYEIKRHIELLKKGVIPIQETRGWNEKKGITESQRSKEEAHDYRYFPEPDIPPIRWNKEQITTFKDQIPELPDEKIKKFMTKYGLSEYDATVLSDEKETAEYFEKAVRVEDTSGVARKDSPDGGEIRITPKTLANWIINKKADITKVRPEELIKLIVQQTQKTFISDKDLEKTIKKVIYSNPQAVADYKSGKQQVLMFLVGQVLKEINGQGEVTKIRELLQKILSR